MTGERVQRLIDNERLAAPERAANTPAVRRRDSGFVRKAYCKADAGTGSTIVCYLDSDSGEAADEITVYCEISGNTSDLNEAGRRLEDGNMLKVYYDGVDSKWRAFEGFFFSEECA